MKEYPIGYGENILDHYRMMVRELQYNDEDMMFFSGNGIKFIADKNSDPELAKKYLDFAYTYKLTVLGPDVPRLPQNYMDKIDEERRKESERWKQELKEKEERFKKKKLIVADLVRNVDFMFKNDEKFEDFKSGHEINKNSSYGNTCFEFAMDLGKLLQIKKSDSGLTNNDVSWAENMLEYYDMSGFQYNTAIRILRDCWTLFDENIFYFKV